MTRGVHDIVDLGTALVPIAQPYHIRPIHIFAHQVIKSSTDLWMMMCLKMLHSLWTIDHQTA